MLILVLNSKYCCVVTEVVIEHNLIFYHVSVSPVGQTPRSARSDKNIRSIQDETADNDIEEVIEEDLLKSDASAVSCHNPS